MIDIENLTYRIGNRTLFEDATLHLPSYGKIGLIGENGCGKTTLFRLILNQEEIDAGEIFIKPDAKFVSVKQEIENGEISILDFVLSADKELIQLQKILAEEHTSAEDLAHAYDRYGNIDGYSATARASAILTGLGFKQADLNKKIKEFSGGWQVRASLAATLFAPSDCLFLDEPTNHLDLETAMWLENYLDKSNKMIIMISHEKQFLNKICNYIVSIYDKKLHLFKGNYDNYKLTRTQQETALIKNIENQQRKQEHMQSFVDRFGAKATKAKQAQSRLKMIEKMEIPQMPSSNYHVKFIFPDPQTKVDNKLLILENLTAGYGSKIVLQDVEFCVSFGDRIALLGANGNGKSTLAKVLSGRLEPKSGTITQARNSKVSYFSQQQADELKLNMSPIETIKTIARDFTETQARAYLARFGITQAKSETVIGKLSGGEKARVLLSINSMFHPHMMIFDEPTNHLDIEAREALVDAINKYKGAVVLITHDFYTLSKTCNKFFIIADNKCAPFNGTLNDYRDFLLKNDKAQTKAEKPTTSIDNKKAKPDSFQLKKLKKEVDALEKKITLLEGKKAELEQKLIDEYSFDLCKSYETCGEELSKAENEWIKLSEKLNAQIN